MSAPVRPAALILVPLLGVAALVAGAAIWLTTPVSFGWFAYAPLTDATFSPMIGAGSWIGPLLLGVGIALVAGWAGYLLGRRRRG